MFDRAGFQDFFFREVGESRNTLNTYNSYLGRIDQAVGGLDERLSEDGSEELLQWMATATAEPIASHRSQSRSILRAYIRYKSDVPTPVETLEEEPSSEEVAASIFKYERELQAAVRSQIGRLEAGLIIDDNGYEFAFESGRSDILARDKNGCAIVIELKAGTCPKGAIEQILGYAQNWLDEGEKRVRAILVSGSFNVRQLAAAKRIPDLELRTYELALQFKSPTSSIEENWQPADD